MEFVRFKVSRIDDENDIMFNWLGISGEFFILHARCHEKCEYSSRCEL